MWNGQNCIIPDPNPTNFPLRMSPMELVRLVRIEKRKAQVFAYAGPYLIAVLYPFSLNMSAIYMDANTNKKYRELK